MESRGRCHPSTNEGLWGLSALMSSIFMPVPYPCFPMTSALSLVRCFIAFLFQARNSGGRVPKVHRRFNANVIPGTISTTAMSA